MLNNISFGCVAEKPFSEILMSLCYTIEPAGTICNNVCTRHTLHRILENTFRMTMDLHDVLSRAVCWCEFLKYEKCGFDCAAKYRSVSVPASGLVKSKVLHAPSVDISKKAYLTRELNSIWGEEVRASRVTQWRWRYTLNVYSSNWSVQFVVNHATSLRVWQNEYVASPACFRNVSMK